MSSTQKQKLGVARALIRKPDLLILNDALNDLDQLAQESILKHIISYNGSKSLIWVISDPELAKYFDRIILLKKGGIAETGNVKELIQKESHLKKLLAIN